MNATIGKTFLALTAFSFLMVGVSGCGRRGAPIPPRERVPQTVEIAGYQQGSEIFLTWKMPARNAEPKSVMNIARADVYRFVEPSDSFTFLTEEEFAERSSIVSTVEFDSKNFGAKTFTVSDQIDFGDNPVTVRYAVRLVNGLGQKAGFSNFISIDPFLRVATSPTGLTAKPSQEAVILSWEKPNGNIDASPSDNVEGYNVYRREGDGAIKKLNEIVIGENTFDDESFEFGKSYTYFVRAVSNVADSVSIESSDSETVSIAPVDAFPPAVPEAVTIAASLNEISIFFASNLENDVVGYFIFRSEDADAPLDNWTQLNEKALTTNTFRDEKVESGRTYHYYVIAIDLRGNKSARSEVVSETVPARQ